jgi:hypothetical protein
MKCAEPQKYGTIQPPRNKHSKTVKPMGATQVSRKSAIRQSEDCLYASHKASFNGSKW